MSSVLFEALRKEALDANLELVRQHLVLYTFGNASGISRTDGVVAIKPSGVLYEQLRAEDMVLTDLEGRVLEGSLRPSSDLPTHLVLYKAFPTIGGVVHAHSEFATAWAQAGRPIPCFGTTHADYFHGPVPVTDSLEPHEIDGGYEKNTGVAICRAFNNRDPDAVPAVLVAGHAPFCWGRHRRKQRTTPSFSKRWRAWPTTLLTWRRTRHPSRSTFMTSTIFANMERAPITGR